MVDKEWLDYLPKDQCTLAVVRGTDPSNFRRLVDLVAKVHEDLPDDLRGQWRSWLVDNAGDKSWDMRTVQNRRIEFEQIVWERKNAKPTDEAQLILADPPWQYDDCKTDNRQIENQYPTQTVDEIAAHINAGWAPPVADDCVLFLWATAPKLREALEVMSAWGFEYRTSAVWDKEKIGMGYWFRGQHELLLVGIRGGASPPEEGARVSSVFREPRGKHSKKPECVYKALEEMFPSRTVKYEFYQREPRAGWKGVGNEVDRS